MAKMICTRSFPEWQGASPGATIHGSSSRGVNISRNPRAVNVKGFATLSTVGTGQFAPAR